MTIGTTIHRFSTCPSTNALAKQLAREGAAQGTVVVAEEQTEGRGTKGRRWHSPRGQGLYASVILRPRRPDLSLLPLLAGIACLEAVREATGLQPALKWPNDIVWEGRKLGGILCEGEFLGNTVSFAVLGIGLNVGQKKADFPADLRRTASSLRLALGREVNPEALEKAIWPALDRRYSAWVRGRKEEIVRAYESGLDIRPGAIIHVRSEQGARRGVYRGIDLQARLKMDEGRRPILLSPAEILTIDYN
jgi:BirA family transcriptional regulator, biotin operon repressor / biotin---[acetyl-CoA-carboxylase] ligase